MNILIENLKETFLSSFIPVDMISVFLQIIAISILSSIMFFTYRCCFNNLQYNKNFNITLVIISFLSAMFMTLVAVNPLLALGTIGTLAIVRFRVNAKDFLDIAFIFWAIITGTMVGVNNYFLSIIITICLSSFLLIFSKNRKSQNITMLIVRGRGKNFMSISSIVYEMTNKSNVKAKNFIDDSYEIVYEISLKDHEENILIEKISSIKDIISVNVLDSNSQV
ncbi:MAG: DUF4956 domain-containing protein [Oscillospiraceae bacterium]|nr:DUF4956 domain-containing protein [Oscillospiraceae bacterium]